MRTTMTFTVLAAIALASGAALAADPPDLMNYQGVLRDDNDNPLDGTYDMVFRFFTAEVGGSEVLVDTHEALHANPVTVTGGMFNVALGSGTITDGSGPGIFISLRKVFKEYQEVYLDVEIDGEVLTPRVRVLAAAYAMNASYLGGRAPGDFVDTSSTAQTKIGPLTADASSVGASIGIVGRGQQSGGYFQDSDTSGYAYVGYGDYGVRGFGNASGGYFRDANSSGYASVGYGHYGIQGYGNTAGAYFKDLENTGRAYVGYGDHGVHGFGSESGGHFEDSDDGTMADVGFGPYGIFARGYGAAGGFLETDGSGLALVAANDLGVDGQGDEAGGWFHDSIDSGSAWVGYGDLGIMAQGTEAGGYFRHPDLSAEAWLAKAYGIEATGHEGGAYLYDSNGTGYARVGWGDDGIFAMGEDSGGEFREWNGSAVAWLAHDDLGIFAMGLHAGGRFSALQQSGYAFVGYGEEGISAHGGLQGGYFQDDNDSGQAHVAYGDRGIWAKGSFAGGTFSHPDGTTFWSDVARSDGHKIVGTGAVSFVQNHPYDENRVIVYTAPEGDEAAVYTRGTARLVGGEARVPLGETFQWVANPDIGLTAHLTPRGDWSDLYVESITTEELVVRAVDGPGDTTFDYFIFGLRLGFEELAVVETKHREAPLPSDDVVQSKYAEQRELRSYNALERFRSMAAGLTGVAPDLSRAAALRQAVLESGRQNLGRVDPAAERAARVPPEVAAVSAPDVAAGDEAVSGAAPDEASATSGSPVGPVDFEQETGPVTRTSLTMFPVSETVEPGDLLALDPERPGVLVHAAIAQDPGVVGIAASEAVSVDGEFRVELAETNYAVLKVDAGYGEIRAGDLLTSSFTPGHAMLAIEMLPGTIVGKALEPLESGTGSIRVLVMPR